MEKDEATNTPKTSGSTPKSAAPESPAKNGNDQKEDSDNADLVTEKDKDTADGDDSCPLEPVEIPDPHPTLEKLFEDIERCISSLPRPTEKDATDGSQQEAKDNASNEAKDTKSDEKEEEDVKDDKVEKEEEKSETDAKEEGEKNDKEEIKDVKDENKEDEKELGDKDAKDEKEAEKVDDGIVEKEKDPVPEELLLLINKFLTWIDDICCEGRCRWGRVPDDDDSFLDSVDQMAKMRESLLSLCSMGLKFEERHGGLINHLSGIQHRAMAYLEEEFRVLLGEYKTEPDHCTLGGPDHNQNSNKDNAAGNKGKSDQDTLPESESENLSGAVEFPGYSQEAVSNLNKIAKKMISAGYEYECCEVYIISRRHAFDDNLHKIGLEKHSIDDIQKMQWEALEREIGSWVKAIKQCTAFYFSGERKMAESVFSEHPLISSYLFSNLSRGVMTQLLNFAEGIGMAKRAAEKLFKTLDMYEAVKEVIPKMEELFPEACVKDVKTETTTVLARLGEAAICIFCDLENSIKAETGRNPVPGGAVHPLTRYTMNYLRYACEYKDTLELVFKEHAKIERTDSTSRPGSRDDYDAGDTSLVISNDESPFSVQLARVMALLDSNLEAKSKLYKDVALSSIFMMNNGRYILQKIRGSPEINACMGDKWCRKRSSELRQYHKNYQRETWSRLLSFLSHEGLSNHGKVQKPVLKERFKSFNAMFDEIHKTQSTWVVSDEQLQSELRVSISAVIIPAYRSFLGRFAQVLDPGRQTEKYIKFQPEDIETYIDELFDGNPNLANSSIFNRKRP